MTKRGTKEHTEKARGKAQETLKIKGLLSFISKKSKKATYKNKLVEDLINSGLYENIYNRWFEYCEMMEETEETDETKIYDFFNDKEIEILSLFDFCEPDELEGKKDGFYIKETPLNI
jgi:hypothetical protein